MISLSGGESDTDLLGPDLGVNSHEDIHTAKSFSILDELIASPPIRFQHTKISNKDFNPWNTHPLHLSILFLRLIPPAPQKLCNKDPKAHAHRSHTIYSTNLPKYPLPIKHPPYI